MKKNNIPLVITWDVDPDRWTTQEYREEALSTAINLCEGLSIKSTFFITANYAHEYPEHIERMRNLGHEVGCHGLTHTDEEEYDRMSEDLQQSYIQKATQILEKTVGSPIRSFRSPRVKTSATTLKLLSDFGYLIDSSVCSQRIDLISSNLINPGWIVAPRNPYHPHKKNPFRRGDLPIWEVPVSAAVVPFISGSLKVFGLRCMKSFFSLLYAEARITGKPIVYLAHPSEFITVNSIKNQRAKRVLSFNRIRTHGFLGRNRLFRLKGEHLLSATRGLFSYIASLPNISFMTLSTYQKFLIEQAN